MRLFAQLSFLVLGVSVYILTFIWLRNSVAPMLGLDKDLVSVLHSGATFVVATFALVVIPMTRDPDKG